MQGFGFAKGFRGAIPLWAGLRGFLFGRSVDLGGKGGGVTLSRHVVGTIGTVLLCTWRRLLLDSSEFCLTRGGWFSCCFLFCRRFLKLWPVRLLRDLGRPDRKPVFGGVFLSMFVFVRERRGVSGCSAG